jgi:acetyltransferase
MLSGGFKGPIWFVNPRHQVVEGQRCFGSVAELPQAPDLAVVATPPRTVPALVAELGQKGTRAAAIITEGIGTGLRDAMLSSAGETGVRIQGPSCLGVLGPAIGLNASISHRAPLSGDLAFVSQSDALIPSIIDRASARSVGFSHIMSLGDMVDVDLGDVLDFLADDPSCRAILLHMVSVTNASKFMSAARRAARTKPVIVMKSGRHAAAVRAGSFEADALATSDAAYEAAFRRAGLLRVRDFEDLFKAADIISSVPPVAGEGLMIVTNSGAAGMLAADRLAESNGELAALSEATRSRLDAVLPPTWSKENPVNILDDAGADRYRSAVDALLEDDATGALLIVNCPSALADSMAVAKATLESIDRHRMGPRRIPVLTAWLGGGAAERARAAFRQQGIPTFETPSDAVKGFMHLIRHARAQFELLGTSTSSPCCAEGYASAAAVLQAAIRSGRSLLTEVEAIALLQAYGIPTVPTHIAEKPADVFEIADEYIRDYGAVVVKILSRDIAHKSEVGGVTLNLQSSDEARGAASAMHTTVGGHVPGAHIDGWVVQPMIRKPQASVFVAGMSVDETFGPVITFGLDGRAAAELRDTAHALPPLDLELARGLMRQTRTFRLLSGSRDTAPVDLEALALVLTRVSCLICAHPEIRQLEINPLLVDGKSVIAFCTSVRVADEAREPRVPMCMGP